MNVLSQAAAAATLVLVPLVVASPAQAATETLPDQAATAASPAQAARETLGLECAGREVVRCVWFNVDHANNRLRARSGIWDASVSDPDPNYTVSTSRVRLHRFVNGAWRYWSGSYAADYDGWHSSVDRAAAGLVGCSNRARYTVRAVAHQKWQGQSPGSGTQYSLTASFFC
jgi:hypothetical protein